MQDSYRKRKFDKALANTLTFVGQNKKNHYSNFYFLFCWHHITRVVHVAECDHRKIIHNAMFPSGFFCWHVYLELL